MEINKSKKYTHLKLQENTIEYFLVELKKNNKEFENEHLILDFSEKINIKIEEIILFLSLSKNHRENGTSFVVISKGIDIDEIPDKINVVPTFIEAINILEMDEIERDLGF